MERCDVNGSGDTGDGLMQSILYQPKGKGLEITTGSSVVPETPATAFSKLTSNSRWYAKSPEPLPVKHA